MNLYDLKPADLVRTVEGYIVEVLKPTEDGQWILVRYVDTPGSLSLKGHEDLCHDDELSEKVDTYSWHVSS